MQMKIARLIGRHRDGVRRGIAELIDS